MIMQFGSAVTVRHTSQAPQMVKKKRGGSYGPHVSRTTKYCSRGTFTVMETGGGREVATELKTGGSGERTWGGGRLTDRLPNKGLKQKP